jgi:hypothetical protein
VPSGTILADTEQASLRFTAGLFLQTKNRSPYGSMPDYSCRHRTGLLKVHCRRIPADTEQAALIFHAGIFLQTQNRPP